MKNYAATSIDLTLNAVKSQVTRVESNTFRFFYFSNKNKNNIITLLQL